MRNILFLLLALLTTPVFSHHIVGGEITYTHVFDDLYNVTLKLYRDCFSDGAEFDDPAVIAVYDGSGNFIDDHHVTYSSITPVNNFVSDSCAGSNSPCVEVAEYHLNNVVFSPGTNYYIVYQRCCRNDGIYNLLDVNASSKVLLILPFFL